MSDNSHAPAPIASSASVTSPPAEQSARTGALAATLGYLLWGLVPLYWKQLETINALELIAHRLVWSLLFLVLLTGLQGGIREVLGALSKRRSISRHLLSSTLLTVNWLVYVWGVNTGHVIETS